MLIYELCEKQPQRRNNCTLRNSRESWLIFCWPHEGDKYSIISPYCHSSVLECALGNGTCCECTGPRSWFTRWPRSARDALCGSRRSAIAQAIDNYIMRAAAVLSCLLFGHPSNGARPLLAHQLDNGAHSAVHTCAKPELQVLYRYVGENDHNTHHIANIFLSGMFCSALLKTCCFICINRSWIFSLSGALHKLGDKNWPSSAPVPCFNELCW